LAGSAPGAQRAGPAGGAEDNAAARGDRPGDAGRAGGGAGGFINGEVSGGEPAVHGGLDRPGLDHRGVPGVADRGAQFPGAIGRIAIPRTRRAAAGGLFGQELARDRGVAVVLPAGFGEPLTGDDPGLRAGHHVGAVTIPAGLG